MLSDALQESNYCQGHYLVTTVPAVEPVSLADFKSFMRIDGSDEDTIITTMIASARQKVEQYTRKALIEQTITYLLDNWPGYEIELPVAPAISITKIFTLDEDDVETTYAATSYYLVSNALPSKVVIRTGDAPPTNSSRFTAGYGIRYKAGYGDAAADVPNTYLEAIMLWAGFVYENRRLDAPMPDNVRKILYPYRSINV